MKKSRNLFVLFSMLLMLATSFSSCKDDKENNEPDTKSIVGKWQFLYCDYWEKEDGQIIDSGKDSGEVFYYTFQKNGTYIEEEDGDLAYGTYILSGNTLILDPGTEDSMVWTIQEIKSDSMVFTYSENYYEDGHRYQYFGEYHFIKVK